MSGMGDLKGGVMGAVGPGDKRPAPAPSGRVSAAPGIQPGDHAFLALSAERPDGSPKLLRCYVLDVTGFRRDVLEVMWLDEALTPHKEMLPIAAFSGVTRIVEIPGG